MKILHSLWSRPGQKKGDFNKCGWPDKKYHYFSWALSCLQFRRFYTEVELVTDKLGYDLLINKIGLPYTTVQVVLDDLNDYHHDLYALGKIYAYNMQEKPFIHADGDVFIWQKFDEKLENSSLLCQNIEAGQSYNHWYSGVFMDMIKNLAYYPEVLDQSINKNSAIVSVNAGIIGGTNIDFFKTYTKEVFAFVDKNIRHLGKINVSVSNTVFEQFLFYALAESQGEKINYLNPEVTFFWTNLSDFTGVPERIKYVHTIGASKKSRSVADAMEFRLQSDYPEYYYRIMNLIRTNQI